MIFIFMRSKIIKYSGIPLFKTKQNEMQMK